LLDLTASCRFFSNSVIRFSMASRWRVPSFYFDVDLWDYVSEGSAINAAVGNDVMKQFVTSEEVVNNHYDTPSRLPTLPAGLHHQKVMDTNSGCGTQWFCI
jgi:hypothetical protein